jgi:hypothetical protein
MAQQETASNLKLRDLIAENPERSFAVAALSGFVVGGGLSSRTSFRIILMALEAMVGDRLIPAKTSSGNGQHSAGNGKDSNEQRRARNNKK